MRGPVGLDAREYKLLLEGGAFPGAPSGKAAKAFWNRHLKLAIDEELDRRNGGKSRASGELKQTKQRSVAFLDTDQGHLAEERFALRLRSDIKDSKANGLPEVTLKFRTPDFLLAAEYLRATTNHLGDTKLEEDIAPLQVARGKKPVAVAKPRSVYSRFSVSTKVTDFDGNLRTLGDVFEQFSALKRYFGRGRTVAAGERLVAGQTICEWVYGDAFVDLGEDLNAEFGCTLWYLSSAGKKQNAWKRATSGDVDPTIAEISFDFDTKNGRMDRAAAERASKLFLAMQCRLPVNAEATSKTALGLPAGA